MDAAAAYDPKLREFDLVSLKGEDEIDRNGHMLEEFAVRQKKTGKGVLEIVRRFEL